MSGRKVWAADEVLSAEDLQEYIQDQVVFVYESSGARASGILSPTEGMVSYLKDTNQVSVYNGTAWVDIAPDVGTPGTYTKVTTDFKGRVTSGTTLSASDIPSLDASKVTSGAFDAARIPSLDASKTTTGTFDLARIPTLDDGRVPNLDASKITSGTFATARIPNLDASKITSGTITRPVNVSGSIFCTDFNASSTVTATNGLFGPSTYNQTNTGRAVFIASNGLFGIGASSERFKENIVDANIDTASVLDIRVRKFNYKKSFDENQPEDIGVIAEELEALGLIDFIYYDAEGIPDGVAYEKLALALIPVLKMQQSQIDSVVARLDELEK
jgi:hypothetical protein